MGDAFFRDGIPPDNEHPSNALGGHFQLLLMGTKGDIKLLENYDNIFNKIFKMTANANVTINGIFIRCEIDPEKEALAYDDPLYLPFLIKIQIWIGNNWKQPQVKEKLIDKIELLDQMKELPIEMYRKFQYHMAVPQRIRFWLYECPDIPFHKKCTTTSNKCHICVCLF